MFEAGVVVAAVIALGQLAKIYIDTKYIPLITLVLGIVGGFLYIPHAAIQDAVMNGVLVGLSANGLFDVTKLLHNKPITEAPVESAVQIIE
jgi:hypothetical protein